jgi:hypothetical protein
MSAFDILLADDAVDEVLLPGTGLLFELELELEFAGLEGALSLEGGVPPVTLTISPFARHRLDSDTWSEASAPPDLKVISEEPVILPDCTSLFLKFAMLSFSSSTSTR